MPELDGLRFIAIFWVAVLLHLVNIIKHKIYNEPILTGSFIDKIILEGGNGVCFFFMISGFILALPFAREKMRNGKKISLRNYYVRRLFRIEPPYLAALIIAFILLIAVGNFTFNELIDNFIASAFYMHNWIYQEHSEVLGIAWSLEIEARFYLFAPLFALVYIIKNNWVRIGILVTLAAGGSIRQFYDFWNPASPFINFLCYFLLGMLLADLFLRKWKLVSHSGFCKWFGIVLFIGLHFIFSTDSIVHYLAKIISLTIFFYIAITNPWWKKILSMQWIAIIGGMCYSIYLLHLIIMSGLTRILVEFPIGNKWLGMLVYGTIIASVVLVISAIFYKLIEQPCMRREWYKRREA